MYFLSANGKTPIHAVKWLPDHGEYRAILQITHGMVEFIGRYRVFAEYLTERGFMVADMHQLRTIVQKDNKGIPYFMMDYTNSWLTKDVETVKKVL